MLKTKTFMALVVFTGLILAISPVAAAGPMDDVRETTDKILSILCHPGEECKGTHEERKQKIRQVVDERFDWAAISRSALAGQWRELNKEEQAYFTELFGKLIERTYMDRIEEYSGEKVIYLDEEIYQDRAKVRVKIVSSEGQEIPAEYRMKKKNGEWLVYDILVEGVSLVKNYRVQFSDILMKSSYEELLKRIEEKVQE